MPNLIFKGLLFFHFCAFLFVFDQSIYAHSWSLSKESDGVRAYTRKVDNSNFKEYKVEMELEATLTSIVAVLMSVQDLPQWVDRTAEASVLKDMGPTESITRVVSLSPFPLKNRETISYGKLRQDATSKIVTLTSEGRPDFLPADARYERVKYLRSQWILTPKTNGKIEVIMIGHADPGGIIPAVLANQFVVMIPFNTVKNLRSQVKKEKYQKIKLKYIKD